MPSQRVIALDPGHRTGWAAATLSENRIDNLRHGVMGQKDMALALCRHQAIYSGQPPSDASRVPDFDVIVFETWRPREQDGSMDWIKGDQLLSAQHVGQIRLAAWLSGAKLKGYGPDRKRPFTASMPADMRARFDDSHEQHDQDALMHLWGYALENWVTDPSNVTIN